MGEWLWRLRDEQYINDCIVQIDHWGGCNILEDFFNQNNMAVLKLPALCPDLSQIEYLWDSPQEQNLYQQEAAFLRE